MDPHERGRKASKRIKLLPGRNDRYRYRLNLVKNVSMRSAVDDFYQVNCYLAYRLRNE